MKIANLWRNSLDARHSATKELSSDVSACYRIAELKRICASLEAATSLLIVGESGIGKTALAGFVADELRAKGFPVALISPSSAKQTLVALCAAFRLPTTTLDGKQATTQHLECLIADFLRDTPAFILIDDAHQLQTSVRHWLEHLHRNGRTFCLFATHPPPRDIFLKLPRIELRALSTKEIRELMRDEAAAHGVQLSRAQQAELEMRCGGNPMLARRVVREEHLGLDPTAPDHQKWIDGTPLIIAAFLCFMLVRIIGRGLHMRDLWMFGAVISIALGIARLFLRSLPREGRRLGQ